MRSFIIGVLSLFSAFHVFASSIAWNPAFIEDENDYDPPIHWLDCFANNLAEGGNDAARFAIQLYYSYFDDEMYFDGAWRHVTGVLINPDSHGGAAFGMNLREMQVGDTVSQDTVRGDRYSYFYANWIDAEPGYDGGSPETSSLAIETGEEVYLGFVTDGADNKYYYGWLSLIFDGTNVGVGQSAMDLSGAPIVILPRQIPEPGTFSLFLVGIVGLLLKRRHLDWRDR